MQNSGLEEAAKYISHDYIYSAWDWRYQPKKKKYVFGRIWIKYTY